MSHSCLLRTSIIFLAEAKSKMNVPISWRFELKRFLKVLNQTVKFFREKRGSDKVDNLLIRTG